MIHPASCTPELITVTLINVPSRLGMGCCKMGPFFFLLTNCRKGGSMIFVSFFELSLYLFACLAIWAICCCSWLQSVLPRPLPSASDVCGFGKMDLEHRLHIRFGTQGGPLMKKRQQTIGECPNNLIYIGCVIASLEYQKTISSVFPIDIPMISQV